MTGLEGRILTDTALLGSDVAPSTVCTALRLVVPTAHCPDGVKVHVKRSKVPTTISSLSVNICTDALSGQTFIIFSACFTELDAGGTSIRGVGGFTLTT